MNVEKLMDQPKRKRKLFSIGFAPHDGIISIGVSPHGFISIGAIPHGVISIGLVPMGAVAIGFVSMGLFSVGSVSMGLMSIGKNSMSVFQLNSEESHQHHQMPNSEMKKPDHMNH